MLRSGFIVDAVAMVQVKYAGLDSFAGVLLFYYIHHRMDPVFTERRPDVLALRAGTPLRLYTRTNSRCVAEGTLAEYPRGRTWGSTNLALGQRQGGTTRMVAKLTEKLIPGALALYPGEAGGEAQALGQLEVGILVLWDAVSQTWCAI